MRADYITTAVRTGGEGPSGVSLLLVPGDSPGLSRTPLKKMGWWASDTATLHFDNVRVPAGNLLGPEGAGFLVIMQNFNSERLTMTAGCAEAARVCLEEATAYAKERQTFGKPLVKHQVIRHKLVDMAQRIAATQACSKFWRARAERRKSRRRNLHVRKIRRRRPSPSAPPRRCRFSAAPAIMRGAKLGLNKPVEYGGMGLDYSYALLMAEELGASIAVACRCRSACRPTWRRRRSRASARTS
jgi:acyl-CoA dehydrogenase